jgi:hypothetical protein
MQMLRLDLELFCGVSHLPVYKLWPLLTKLVCILIVLLQIWMLISNLLIVVFLVAKIPGLEWVSDFDEGRLKLLINAYLPVLALLAIIMILPIVFEAIAIRYEKRKTISDVNRSVVSRYFYYQLANIYISVTAGSIWMSASEIIDRPSAGLEILG